MKRLTAILLLLAMLAGSAVSCSEKPAGEGPDAASVTPAGANEPAAVPEEEETELTDGLPDTDMQGFELDILHHSQEWLAWAYNVLEADELTGETLTKDNWMTTFSSAAVQKTETETEGESEETTP